MSKSIVITGCSTGFGRVTALHLAAQGWTVFATVRKESDRTSLLAEANEKGCAARLNPLLCDITDAAQVAELARSVAAAAPQLDALVNNAGTAFPAPLELLSVDELRSQLEINVVAQLAVTQALLPLLKAARGTIINVSSVGGRIATPVLGAYNISKFGLEALSDVLRVELAPFGLRVVIIEPAGSATAIWNTSRRRANIAAAEHSPYQPLIATMLQVSHNSAAHGFPPQLFADTVFKILTSRSPHSRYALPAGSSGRSILLRKLLPDAWWDHILRRSLKW
jgi:NAD(P)-dependent dehydrogenase (short-subunit alcohol dehydrogenase family)